MNSSLVIWIACAVLLFWAVGAYNRLVRLRGEVNTAFGTLEAELARHVQLVEQCLPEGESQPASLFDGTEGSFWSGLQGAAHQLQASLAAARQRPLAPDGIAALGAAQDVLGMAWERAERNDAHDLAGPRLPPTLTSTRAQLVAQSNAAAMQFNQAIERYNRAIGQFPAILLAWVFGFKPGRPLGADR
jgi:LemA protein